MVTSSPTRIPPVSSAAFQVNPKSLRLIFVVADNPIRVLPHGSFVGSLGPSTVKVTGRVMPWIVSSPATDSSPPPSFETFVERNDRVGNLSTSKKSALFKCASRCGSRVLIVDASISACTRELAMFCSSNSSEPFTAVNSPFTFEIIMCLTLNWALEWTGSMFQVVVFTSGMAIALMILLLRTRYKMLVITNKIQEVLESRTAGILEQGFQGAQLLRSQMSKLKMMSVQHRRVEL